MSAEQFFSASSIGDFAEDRESESSSCDYEETGSESEGESTPCSYEEAEGDETSSPLLQMSDFLLECVIRTGACPCKNGARLCGAPLPGYK